MEMTLFMTDFCSPEVNMRFRERSTDWRRRIVLVRDGVGTSAPPFAVTFSGGFQVQSEGTRGSEVGYCCSTGGLAVDR